MEIVNHGPVWEGVSDSIWMYKRTKRYFTLAHASNPYSCFGVLSPDYIFAFHFFPLGSSLSKMSFNRKEQMVQRLLRINSSITWNVERMKKWQKWTWRPAECLRLQTRCQHNDWYCFVNDSHNCWPSQNQYEEQEYRPKVSASVRNYRKIRWMIRTSRGKVFEEGL